MIVIVLYLGTQGTLEYVDKMRFDLVGFDTTTSNGLELCVKVEDNAPSARGLDALHHTVLA